MMTINLELLSFGVKGETLIWSIYHTAFVNFKYLGLSDGIFWVKLQAMRGISLILPTYNERDNIAPLITRIFSALVEGEVIVVDDDSPDETWRSAQELCRKYPRLKVHRRINERGLRSAIQAGIDAAEGEYVGWMDCDLAMPPELFVDMAQCLHFFDLVVGSRYVVGGSDQRSVLRRYTSIAINILGRRLLGTKTRDLTSGFILSKRSVIQKFPLEGDYGEYCIALIFRTEASGYRVAEVPYRFIERTSGSSKTFDTLTGFFSRGKGYLGMIIRLGFERFRK